MALAVAPLWCHTGAMDLTQYVENLRRELAIAAGAGGDEARALAERLTAPLEPATRLMLLDALSAAAEEITREIAPRSGAARARGRGAAAGGGGPPPGGGGCAAARPAPQAPAEPPEPPTAPPPPEPDDAAT